MFSEAAETALVKFLAEKSKRQDSYFEYLDHGYTVTRECLDAIADASRKDLQLQGLDLPWGARARHKKEL